MRCLFCFVLQIVVAVFLCLLTSADAVLPVFAQREFRDNMIRFYFNQRYSSKEICGLLLFVHHIVVSRRQLKRIKFRLRLRMRENFSPVEEIFTAMVALHQNGYSNYGYRMMWKMLHVIYNLRTTQETVRLILKGIDPEGVELRRRHRLRRRRYVKKGPNFAIHIDGYDKLKPFGIAIHGAIDGYSRKILWLKADRSNNNPRVVASYFLEHVRRFRRVPRVVRSDKGTENVIVRDLQIALRYHHNDGMAGLNSYQVGRSTSNQRIERFWRTLTQNFGQFWRNLFKDMRDAGFLNDGDRMQVECLRFCFTPIIQEQLNAFKDVWNRHRVRAQHYSETPSDIPDIVYYQPEVFDARDYSHELTCNVAIIDRLYYECKRQTHQFGCTEAFLEGLELLTGLQRDALTTRRSLDSAVELFYYLTDVMGSL